MLCVAWTTLAALPSERTLAQLVLPGTHDTAAHNLTDQLVPGYWPAWVEEAVRDAERRGIPAGQVITAWATAQRLSVPAQLAAGARYLDLRAGWDAASGTWRAHHAEFGVSIAEVLSDVAAFVRAERREVRCRSC